MQQKINKAIGGTAIKQRIILLSTAVENYVPRVQLAGVRHDIGRARVTSGVHKNEQALCHDCFTVTVSYSNNRDNLLVTRSSVIISSAPKH